MKVLMKKGTNTIRTPRNIVDWQTKMEHGVGKRTALVRINYKESEENLSTDLVFRLLEIDEIAAEDR